MKYRRYKYYEHTENYCHIMRCYTCNGIGHKSQECWNSRRQKTTKVWRRKSEEQRQKDYASTTYVNGDCSRHMEKNQINYFILTNKQQKKETTNAECLKHAIEDFPENISDINVPTGKSINVLEDLHRRDKYKSIF